MAAARCAVRNTTSCKRVDACATKLRELLAVTESWSRDAYVRVALEIRQALSASVDHRPVHYASHGLIALVVEFITRATRLAADGVFSMRDMASWVNIPLDMLTNRTTARPTYDARNALPAREMVPLIEGGVLTAVVESARLLGAKLHENEVAAMDILQAIEKLMSNESLRAESAAVRPGIQLVVDLARAPIFARTQDDAVRLILPTIASHIMEIVPPKSAERRRIAKAMYSAASHVSRPTFAFDEFFASVLYTLNETTGIDGNDVMVMPLEFCTEENFAIVARNCPEMIRRNKLEMALVVPVFLIASRKLPQPIDVPGRHGPLILKAIVDRFKLNEREDLVNRAWRMIIPEFLLHTHEHREYATLLGGSDIIKYITRLESQLQSPYILNWVTACPAAMESYLKAGKAQYLLDTAANTPRGYFQGVMFRDGHALLGVLVHTAAKIEETHGSYAAVWESDKLWEALREQIMAPHGRQDAFVHIIAFLSQFEEGLPLIVGMKSIILLLLSKALNGMFDMTLTSVGKPILNILITLATVQPEGWAVDSSTLEIVDKVISKMNIGPHAVGLEHYDDQFYEWTVLASYTQLLLLTHADTPALRAKRPALFKAAATSLVGRIYGMVMADGRGVKPVKSVDECACLALWVVMDRFPAYCNQGWEEFRKDILGPQFDLSTAIHHYCTIIEAARPKQEWTIAHEACVEIRALLARDQR